MKSSLLCMLAIQQVVAGSTPTSSGATDAPCMADVCLQKEKRTTFVKHGARTDKANRLWRPYIETAVLEEDPETNITRKSIKRRVYLPKKAAVEDPLRRLQLTQTVASPFTVEECSTLTTLSSAKRSELAKGKGKFCILVFGKILLVAGETMDSCGHRNLFLYAASVAAQNVDLDWDGQIDDARVGDALDATRNTGKAAAILWMGCTMAEEVPEAAPKFNSDITGYPAGAQLFKAKAKGTVIEEVFHWFHDGAWAWVYPELVGYKGHANFEPDEEQMKKLPATASSLAKCHKQATCEFWMHPENSYCSNAQGVACANPDLVPPAGKETVASVAAYDTSKLKPGACAAKPGTCADAACDLDEFFHKIYLAIIGETRCTAYRYVKASGGKEPTMDWSHGVYDKSILNDMAQSTECAAFLNELKTKVGVGKTYKMPTSKYRADYSIGGCRDCPTPMPTGNGAKGEGEAAEQVEGFGAGGGGGEGCIEDVTKEYAGDLEANEKCVYRNTCGVELAIKCNNCPNDYFVEQIKDDVIAEDGCYVDLCKGLAEGKCSVNRWGLP